MLPSLPVAVAGADPLLIAAVIAIIVFAAWIHGLVGIGFPLVITPGIALLTDLQTAVVLTVLPNIAINILSIVRDPGWPAVLRRHAALAGYVLAGSLVGTQFLLRLPGGPMKLLLGGVLLLALQLPRVKRLDWNWLRQQPRRWEAVFGLLAGFLSGSINISAPPLVIYFTALDLAPLASVQLFNLCFIVGKITQAGSLAWHGALTLPLVLLSIPLTLLAVGCLLLGMRRQAGLAAATHRRWLDATLLATAVVLLGQGSYELGQ